ncbi:MAG TPA: hypothetical protein VN805_05430 [Caulobacteraceae bacterium]|nr:hypothetical protein [Caulobacteraceae bacterium]
MTRLLVAACLMVTALAQTAAAHPQRAMHICKPGYSWRKVCLQLGPAAPGRLFGACLKTGYGCVGPPPRIQ